MFLKSDIKVCPDGNSMERLRAMRQFYEGYAEALGGYLCMPLPPWIADLPHKDNWLVVAKLRALTEDANPLSATGAASDEPEQTIATLVDDFHDF